ncbi:MAG: ribonuclease HII [Cyanobacteria bacterium P01_H01_bin.130]
MPRDCQTLAGVDEVGRGCLFGPVVAAAVMVSAAGLEALEAAGVRDSKALSPAQRQRLVPLIQSVAIAWQVGSASVAEIDRMNILQAALLAMKRAVEGLDSVPDRCWVDGNKTIPQLQIPQTTLVRGDQRSVAIAAASILAKEWRDQKIIELAQHYPGYDLASNKGYGTAKHRAALKTLGLTPYHRLSFAPCQAIAARTAAPDPELPLNVPHNPLNQ